MADKRTKSKKQNARVTKVRGITVAEYHRLYRRIVAGEMTWQQAEERGHCTEQNKRGRKRLPLPQVKPAKGKS